MKGRDGSMARDAEPDLKQPQLDAAGDGKANDALTDALLSLIASAPLAKRH